MEFIDTEGFLLTDVIIFLRVFDNDRVSSILEEDYES